MVVQVSFNPELGSEIYPYMTSPVINDACCLATPCERNLCYETRRSNFQNFLSCLQTSEFGFEHVPSLESLILIARDRMQLDVRHVADEVWGEDPEGIGL